MQRHVYFFIGLLLLGFFITGCASVSVQSVQQTQEHFYAPKIIYVQSYTFNQEGVAVSRSGEELRQFQQLLSKELVQALQKEIQTKLLTCKILAPGQQLPQGPYWLIKGKFDQVRQGNRALRGLVGLGLGKTRTNVTTQVYALNERTPQLIYTIKTIGTSGSMPGAVPGIVMGPAGLLGGAEGIVGGTLQSGTSGLSFDIRRTAREITAALSQYLYQHNALSEGQQLPVKYKRS